VAKRTVKQRIRAFLRSPKRLLIASVLLVLAGTLLFANKGLWRHAQLMHEIDGQQRKQQQLDKDEQVLTKQVGQLKNEDPATLERIAREKYGMKRQGETIYRDSE